MLYGPGLPQKLIGGWTDEVGLGSYEGNVSRESLLPSGISLGLEMCGSPGLGCVWGDVLVEVEEVGGVVVLLDCG